MGKIATVAEIFVLPLFVIYLCFVLGVMSGQFILYILKNVEIGRKYRKSIDTSLREENIIEEKV